MPRLVELGQVVLEKKIFKFRQCILAIWYLSSLGKGRGPSLNKLGYHSPKDALCQVRLKLAKWFWRRFLNNFLNVFLLFRNYLPLEKSGGPSFELESPLPKDALCQVWLKLAQWFWRKRRKCEKFTRQ